MIENPPIVKPNLRIYTLVDMPVYANLIKHINSSYMYWEKVKYQHLPNGINTPEELWAMVRTARKFNSQQFSFENTGVDFTIYITDYMQQLLHQFDMNIGGYLGTQNVIPEDDKQRYLVSSIMEEAIASSQMEGASTTRRQAKEMLRKDIKPKNRSDQMILNNYITIKHIAQNKTDNLTPEAILEIHRLITHKTLDNPQEEGVFRDSDDIFVVNHSDSEVVHTPPQKDKVPVWINELCDFFNDDPTPFFIHPIIKGIIIHFLVGYIHPFCDGNGRTARALFYWYMLRKGYWLTEYLSISRIIYKTKVQYEKAYLYTEVDENDLSYFVQYNLVVMEKAFDSLREYIQSKIKEQQQTAKYHQIPYLNERQALLLKLIEDKPHTVLTVRDVQNRFVVSQPTARTDILGLCNLGLLKVVKVNNKKSNYIRADEFEQKLKTLNNI